MLLHSGLDGEAHSLLYDERVADEMEQGQYFLDLCGVIFCRPSGTMTGLTYLV